MLTHLNSPKFIRYRDSKEKDFELSNVGNKSWKVLKVEIDKCDLLCSNCHRIEHSNNQDVAFLEEVRNYKGSLLL